MSNTPLLDLPLLQAAQAQKHVTVNEALVRIDALAQLVLQSVTVSTPPSLASDGACYGVPASAVNEWSGHDGAVAIRSNGGWVFVPPQAGWRAQVVDVAAAAIYDGASWVLNKVSASPAGAGMVIEALEFDHTIATGPTSTVAYAIPGASIVFGITGRVLNDVTGSLTDWQLGSEGSTTRYGSGLGLAQGSWIRGLTSAPLTYYSDADLELTAQGGSFAGGQVRLVVHLARLTLPSL